MEYLFSFPESDILKMYEQFFKEDYKRRGYKFDEKTKKPKKEKQEELKKLYGW